MMCHKDIVHSPIVEGKYNFVDVTELLGAETQKYQWVIIFKIENIILQEQSFTLHVIHFVSRVSFHL